MTANPNTLNYWLRDGTVLPPYMLGSVSGTADLDYWVRDGTILFPAATQNPSVTEVGTGASTATLSGSATGAVVGPMIVREVQFRWARWRIRRMGGNMVRGC